MKITCAPVLFWRFYFVKLQLQMQPPSPKGLRITKPIGQKQKYKRELNGIEHCAIENVLYAQLENENTTRHRRSFYCYWYVYFQRFSVCRIFAYRFKLRLSLAEIKHWGMDVRLRMSSREGCFATDGVRCADGALCLCFFCYQPNGKRKMAIWKRVHLSERDFGRGERRRFEKSFKKRYRWSDGVLAHGEIE